MGEPLAQMHGHERDDLHRLAGAGRLLDKHVFGSAADVEYEFFLIVPQSL